MTRQDISTFLRPGARAHLIGVGGVSMAPLAEVLYGRGMTVTGSDRQESPTVDHLRDVGIKVIIGHFPASVEGVDCVIRTAAVHDDNPEIMRARELGIPVFERAQAWGYLMRGYRNALCISGTHGKTSTTSMCTHIFMAAQADPTVMIGGTLPLLGAGHRVGRGETIILESCEYCNSFLSFFPTVAVVLNIEADHLDFFKDLQDVEKSFRAFTELVPQDGWVVYNRDDENTVNTLRGLERRSVSFGLEHGNVHAANLTWDHGIPTFDIICRGETVTTVTLQVPGIHNVKNALAAAAAALVLKVPYDAVKRGLESFHGAGRRFERQGEYHGAAVYDDYAHHPGELGALLDMAKTLGYQRVICAFQPHTYTRTKALFDDFVKVLQTPDVTLLTDIYAARETNDVGVSSKDLADQIPGALYRPSLDDLLSELKQLARPGDLILTVGAGDIYTVGKRLAEAE